MVLSFKPAFPEPVPQISCHQDRHRADQDPVFFVLPERARVKVLNPPPGVESNGNWGKIRRQIGRVCADNDQLPDVTVDVTQRWLGPYGGKNAPLTTKK